MRGCRRWEGLIELSKMDEMDKRLVLNVARMDPDGEELTGEVDAIDLEEEFVHPFGGIRYCLTAQLFGSELLVRGHLEQDFTLVCSRCGKDFDTTIKVDDFTMSCEVAENQAEVDLTDEARESIILALPTYPVCDVECPGIERTEEKPTDDRWGALDAVKVEKRTKKKEQ